MGILLITNGTEWIYAFDRFTSNPTKLTDTHHQHWHQEEEQEENRDKLR